MKKNLLLLAAAALSATSFIVGCQSDKDPNEEVYAEIRDILSEGEAYKTHEKQKDKFVLPNASLETSRALYLPIGGAFTDIVKETVGDDYLMEVKEKATKPDKAKIWDSLMANYSEQWDTVTVTGKEPRLVTMAEKEDYIISEVFGKPISKVIGKSISSKTIRKLDSGDDIKKISEEVKNVKAGKVEDKDIKKAKKYLDGIVQIKEQIIKNEQFSKYKSDNDVRAKAEKALIKDLVAFAEAEQEIVKEELKEEAEKAEKESKKDKDKKKTPINYKNIEKAGYYIAEKALIESLRESVEKKTGVFNGDIGLKGARTSMQKLISGAESLSDADLENAVVVEIIKKVRFAEAAKFTGLSESEEAVREYLKEQNKKFEEADKMKAAAEEKSTIVVWLGLDSANKSGVYNNFLKVKAAAEKKMNDEKNAAWDEVVEADRKVAAFSTYWVARVGRLLYPVVIPLVPIPQPVGGILTASTPIATEALDGVTSKLEKSDEWLPKSLTPELDNSPAMKAQFGDNPSMDDILAKLGSDDFVKTLLDQKKINMLKKAAEVSSNPMAALTAGPEILEAIDMGAELSKTLKADLDASDYGMVPLHMLGTLGSNLGTEFLQVLNEQLNPYRYANDIALKRIEYTNKAMSWITDDRMTKIMDDISADN